jgi:hypothetical protein
MARERPDPDHYRDRPLAAEARDEAVQVLEVEEDLRHRVLRAGRDLGLEAAELLVEGSAGRPG